jgi:hypothetical protein
MDENIEKIDDQTYYNYFGEDFWYYKNQIKADKIRHWNWAAFLLGPFWLLHKNLYLKLKEEK